MYHLQSYKHIIDLLRWKEVAYEEKKNYYNYRYNYN